jgi:molybdopterin converting factor small subunit
VIAPMAGGSLIGKIHKAFKELERIGLIEGPVKTRMHGAQATGCNPISGMVKSGAKKVKPVRNPLTIAKSLAIGDPADGFFAAQLIRETGGWSDDVDDEAIIDAMRLLAETEGIWTETAGGVTVAVTQKLIEQGRIDRDESIVICITGNGLKTQEPLLERTPKPVVIKPTLEELGAESMPVIRIPTTMRPHAGGLDRVVVIGTTVGELLDQLGTQYPALRERLFDGDELRGFVNVYVNNEDIRYLEDLATAVGPNDEVSIIPAVAGG